MTSEGLDEEADHPGVVAVPSALIRVRISQITASLKAGGVLPDMAAVAAMRVVHDAMLQQNLDTGFLLDREPEGKPS